MLVGAGSGALTQGEPDSKGVTKGAARDTLMAQYNDLASVERLLDANPGEVAAVIVEPVAANMGVVPPEEGFCVRSATSTVRCSFSTRSSRVSASRPAVHRNISVCRPTS